MPPVRHGRFTVNVVESILRRDNSGRFDVVAIDEWDDVNTLVRTISMPMGEPIHQRDVAHLISSLNSGRIPPRFLGQIGGS